MTVAWDGFDADTRESLKGARSDARSSFYGSSSTRMRVGIWAVALCLAVAVVGLMVEQPLGHILSLGGISGLVLVAVWLSYRP